MSGNNALSAARRRRAGAQDVPTSNTFVTREQTPQQVMSPEALLMNHDVRLHRIEQAFDKVYKTLNTSNLQAKVDFLEQQLAGVLQILKGQNNVSLEVQDSTATFPTEEN